MAALQDPLIPAIHNVKNVLMKIQTRLGSAANASPYFIILQVIMGFRAREEREKERTKQKIPQQPFDV